MYSNGPPHMAEQKQDDQHEHTFSNYVRIRDVVQKTCQMRWTIVKSSERGSGISVLPARHDDEDDDDNDVAGLAQHVSHCTTGTAWTRLKDQLLFSLYFTFTLTQRRKTQININTKLSDKNIREGEREGERKICGTQQYNE